MYILLDCFPWYMYILLDYLSLIHVDTTWFSISILDTSWLSFLDLWRYFLIIFPWYMYILLDYLSLIHVDTSWLSFLDTCIYVLIIFPWYMYILLIIFPLYCWPSLYCGSIMFHLHYSIIWVSALVHQDIFIFSL